uniref:DUF2428 domain-containing protein n=1 Tax=Macrostomum lignano TaxID=282301 RepID=A0A1I8JPC8_9PLAT
TCLSRLPLKSFASLEALWSSRVLKTAAYLLEVGSGIEKLPNLRAAILQGALKLIHRGLAAFGISDIPADNFYLTDIVCCLCQDLVHHIKLRNLRTSLLAEMSELLAAVALSLASFAPDNPGGRCLDAGTACVLREACLNALLRARRSCMPPGVAGQLVDRLLRCCLARLWCCAPACLSDGRGDPALALRHLLTRGPSAVPSGPGHAPPGHRAGRRIPRCRRSSSRRSRRDRLRTVQQLFRRYFIDSLSCRGLGCHRRRCYRRHPAGVPPVARRSGFLRQCLSEVLEFRSELCRHAGRLDEIFVETFRFFSIVWNAWVVACFEVEQLPLARPMLSSSQTSKALLQQRPQHGPSRLAWPPTYFSRDLLTAVMNGLQCARLRPGRIGAAADAGFSDNGHDAASAELLDSLVHCTDLRPRGVFAFLYIASLSSESSGVCQRSLAWIGCSSPVAIHLLSLMTPLRLCLALQSAQPANIRDMVRMRNEEATVRALASRFRVSTAPQEPPPLTRRPLRCPRLRTAHFLHQPGGLRGPPARKFLPVVAHLRAGRRAAPPRAGRERLAAGRRPARQPMTWSCCATVWQFGCRIAAFRLGRGERRGRQADKGPCCPAIPPPPSGIMPALICVESGTAELRYSFLRQLKSSCNTATR